LRETLRQHIRILKKLIASGCVLIMCPGLSGCMTLKTIDRAQGSPMLTLRLEEKPDGQVTFGSETEVFHETPPDPFYYMFVPITLAADVATSPFQIWAWATDYHPCK